MRFGEEPLTVEPMKGGGNGDQVKCPGGEGQGLSRGDDKGQPSLLWSMGKHRGRRIDADDMLCQRLQGNGRLSGATPDIQRAPDRHTPAKRIPHITDDDRVIVRAAPGIEPGRGGMGKGVDRPSC